MFRLHDTGKYYSAKCKTGEETIVPTKALFIYIGTRPGTDWLNDLVLKDEKGYILSGSDVVKAPTYNTTWKLKREPFLPETSIPEFSPRAMYVMVQ